MTTDLREKIAEVLAGHGTELAGGRSAGWYCTGCEWSRPYHVGPARAAADHNEHVAEAILAAIGEPREEALKIAARALLGEADAYDEQWCRKPVKVQAHLDWDRGYVRGMQAAAHSVANGIDRPEWLTEFAERHAAEGPVDTEDPRPALTEGRGDG